MFYTLVMERRFRNIEKASNPRTAVIEVDAQT